MQIVLYGYSNLDSIVSNLMSCHPGGTHGWEFKMTGKLLSQR